MASLSKLMALASSPAYWPALLQGVAPTVEHREALKDFDFKTVVDVGANKGQFAFFAATQWPLAELHCFEPQPGPRAKLDHLLGSRVTSHECALGTQTGTAELHLATRADSSSLLPLGEAQKRLYRMDEVGTVTVPVERLDTMIKTLTRPALLKIDVQGFEYEVLQGASALIHSFECIYVEASFTELYEGQKLADGVTTYLEEMGFSCTGRFNSTGDETRNLVQADLLFRRQQRG
ncbi:FkbM family methyltransferase [Pyruvatibacter sp.]|uniref:FkbM family methyltransferase n=1 Tax=Pyruvatibacter sp. TaxID=1981328 RepID=UPI0032F00841